MLIWNNHINNIFLIIKNSVYALSAPQYRYVCTQDIIHLSVVFEISFRFTDK